MANATVVNQLVPPGVVEQAHGILIWHGGLIATPEMTFISVVVEHSDGQPPFDREWLRNNDMRSIIAVSIVDHAGKEVASLGQGSTSGTAPIMGSRYIQQSLDPGTYRLEIRVTLSGDTFSARYSFSN
jgi:hypothetical protein